MNSVVYVRVSTDEQVQCTSLDVQQKQCLDFAKSHGLAYDFENGFGTIELNESYLLLQKIASEDASDSIVVAINRTSWNLIKAELISMADIVTRYQQEQSAVTLSGRS